MSVLQGEQLDRMKYEHFCDSIMNWKSDFETLLEL